VPKACKEGQRTMWEPIRTCEEDQKVACLISGHLAVDPLQNLQIRGQLGPPLLLAPPLATPPLLGLRQTQVLLPHASWQLEVLVRWRQILDLYGERPPRNLELHDITSVEHSTVVPTVFNYTFLHLSTCCNLDISSKEPGVAW